MRFLVFFVAVLLVSSPVFAAEGRVVQCGVPEKPILETDPALDFCDIYTRQIAYVEQQQDFRSLIEERRDNYVAPRNEAYEAYRKKMHQERYPQQ